MAPAVPMRSRHVTVAGASAHVHWGGEGEPALLLLHGGWGDAAMHWAPIWNRLAAHAQVIAPDLPGLGDPHQEGLPSVPAYVDWLAALLDALGVARVVCVGNSFGASLAWSFAGRRPERCAGVVLVDGVPMPRTPPPLRWLGRRRVGRSVMGAVLNRVSFTPKALPRAFADPGCAPGALHTQLLFAPRRRFETFLDCLIAGDGPPAPRAPVLVVWGEDDRLPGTRVERGRKVAQRIPGARFVALKHAGHFPQLEQPDAFASAISRFVA